jgi:myo-inositol-1(or 4)-monophosphatase
LADVDASDAISERDANLLKDTVREAGALALSLFRTELRNWTKGASSPVSEADIAVNELLERRLRSATPDYGWLSEESADDERRLTKRLVWIVDPIDGTRGYLAGCGVCTRERRVLLCPARPWCDAERCADLGDLGHRA